MFVCEMRNLNLEVNLNGGSHRRLDVNLSNILPLLLEKTSKEVSGKLGVDDDLLLFHCDVSNGNVQAHDLLHLEFDGRLHLVDLLLHVIRTGEESWELSGLGEARSKKTRDLLDHVVGSKEKVVALSQLLDKLLVLVELLQIFNAHVIDTDTVSLFTMGCVSQHATLQIRTWNGGELESSGETFVANRIVVLQSDLDLNSLREVTLLSLHLLATFRDGFTLRKGQNIVDSLVQKSRIKLRHFHYSNSSMLPSVEGSRLVLCAREMV